MLRRADQYASPAASFKRTHNAWNSSGENNPLVTHCDQNPAEGKKTHLAKPQKHN